MSLKFKGELEIDVTRGVIYFHLSDRKQMEKKGIITLLRICRLKIPHNFKSIDITHMEGASY